ncbi:hypothetical protein [Gordonia araii]|nr:hypothetical protein [Gordonia araii]NNG96591.1 hypothetical protein [Gordonia araii NBRC 100433]
MESFKFDPMSTAASDAGTFEGGVQRDAQAILNAITGLDWSGKAKFAASDRAIDESSDRKAVAKALGDIADAARSGQSVMSGYQNESLSAAKGYEADGYNVAQDWTVTDGYNYGLADALAADDPAAQRRLAALKASRANTAKNATVKLKNLALDFHTADQACRSKLNGAIGALGSLAPVVAGLNPKAADGIVDALRSGKPLTAAQLKQLQAATNLTPEQIDALRNGHYVEIPQGQHSFMRTLLSGLDGMSVTDIRGLGAEGQQDQVHRALSNAMQLSSAPNVGTSAGDQGGMGLLPSNVQSLLRDPKLVTKVDAHRGFGQAGHAAPTTVDVEIPRLRELMDLHGLVESGDRDYRMGTDLDRGMLKQIAQIGPSTATDKLSLGSIPVDDFREFMSKATATLASDKIAVHDFITGENMNATCTPGTTYDTRAHLDGILDYRWGAERTGIDDLFGWLKDGAHSPNAFQAELARNAADSLGHYLASDWSAGDTDLPTQKNDVGSNSNIGKINPHLTRTLAEIMSQYLGGFSGAPEGPNGVETYGVKPMTAGDLDQLFKVLNSDPEAGRTINSASILWQQYMAHLGHDGNPDAGALGFAAGKLNQSMIDGSNAQIILQQGREFALANNQYNAVTNEYMRVASLVGSIPYIGPLLAGTVPQDFVASLTGATQPTYPEAMSNEQIEGLKSLKIPTLADTNMVEFSQYRVR